MGILACAVQGPNWSSGNYFQSWHVAGVPLLSDTYAMCVYLAARENVRTLFTLDRQDFSVYRTGRKRALRIVPEHECLF